MEQAVSIFFGCCSHHFEHRSDNIRVYTPMFTQHSSAGQTTTLIVVLMAMTGVWCIA